MEIWKNDDGTFGATMSRNELRFIYRLLYDGNCEECPATMNDDIECISCGPIETDMLLALTEE